MENRQTLYFHVMAWKCISKIRKFVGEILDTNWISVEMVLTIHLRLARIFCVNFHE